MRVQLRVLGVVAGLLMAVPAVPAGAGHYSEFCPADPRVGSTQSLGLASGRYVLPREEEPTVLIAMFHGYGNDSCSWQRHLLKAANEHGAVAFAMDYTGQDPVTHRGWRVLEGAADSNAAARHFLREFPTIETVVSFGISMGGNASGLAVASGATRPDGVTPLYDYWVDIEGVNNLTEEYLIARGVSPVNATGAEATADIEAEAGGPIESNPDAYRNLTLVLRTGDIQVKGAVLVHGLDDGLVPYNQSQEMWTALTLEGIPAEMYTVVTRGEGESGTTGTAIFAGPVFAAAGQTYQSPLAGHGWEGSLTQRVVQTGFERTWRLIDNNEEPAVNQILVP